jgi:hypothetical protein
MQKRTAGPDTILDERARKIEAEKHIRPAKKRAHARGKPSVVGSLIWLEVRLSEIARLGSLWPSVVSAPHRFPVTSLFARASLLEQKEAN